MERARVREGKRERERVVSDFHNERGERERERDV